MSGDRDTNGEPPGPRRLLAVDGGGVRGVVALEVLAAVERTLRAETGDPDLRLGDWFDYVAGTSTGSIIATGIALGRSVGARFAGARSAR